MVAFSLLFYLSSNHSLIFTVSLISQQCSVRMYSKVSRVMFYSMTDFIRLFKTINVFCICLILITWSLFIGIYVHALKICLDCFVSSILSSYNVEKVFIKGESVHKSSLYLRQKEKVFTTLKKDLIRFSFSLDYCASG